jgi:hypothetical protein
MLRVSLPGFVFAMVLAFPVGAAAAGCEPVMAAQQKALRMPVRTIMTVTMPNGLKVPLVMITADGKIYEQQKDGSWKVSEQPKKYIENSPKWADKDCTAEGSEAIGGDTADVFFHRESSFLSGSDQRFWISKVSGLIVKSWSNVGGIQLESANDYINVVVPVTTAGGATK